MLKESISSLVLVQKQLKIWLGRIERTIRGKVLCVLALCNNRLNLYILTLKWLENKATYDKELMMLDKLKGQNVNRKEVNVLNIKLLLDILCIWVKVNFLFSVNSQNNVWCNLITWQLE